MNRFKLDEFRQLSGYQYEPPVEQPKQRVQAQPRRQVVEQRQAPPRQPSMRQEIRALKNRIAVLEQRVERVDEEQEVIREDHRGLKRLVEEARYSVAPRTVYLPQETRVVYRDRPTPAPAPRAYSPAAAQLEAAIRQPPAPPAAPKAPEPEGTRFSLLEVD